MGFDEKAVRAGGDGAAGQNGSKLALAARFIASSAGQLHGMSGIENDRDAKTLYITASSSIYYIRLNVSGIRP